ncbi:MAG: serine/threonine-protein kinase [Isosphaeraceae bacterium]|nr:serine/threonine-protein kinase [Isosphaeraceae bacterium]
MSAMAPRQPGASLDETADYGHAEFDPAFDRPRVNVGSQGPHRYLFGSGARPLEGYTIKRAIGRGGFGEVYYATSDSGKEVALKLITRNADVERRGVSQCMNLKCPNLLTVYNIHTNESGETFVVMEYVTGPSLASVLAKHPQGLPPNDVLAWLKGLVAGVDYLHDHGIVHRDLKPANLFIEEGIVKIGDYGLSKMISPEQASAHSESIGTCHYMAPEISNGRYGKPVDIYAIGVILFEMLTGRVPFEGQSVGEVLMKHLTARPDLSVLAEPWKSIVAKALSKVPGDRQARAVDLLPATSAPRARDVRYIGDGKTTPPLDSNPARAAVAVTPEPKPVRPADDVLRITDEEPPFYIGPNTRPPGADRNRGRFGPTAPIRWMGDVVFSRTRLRMQRAQKVATPPRPRTPTPRPATHVAPPVAPPVPTKRERFAELTSSMFGAAFFTALAALPIAAAEIVDVSRRPENLAFLYAMTVFGTWGVLIANKFFEGKQIDPVGKRIVYLILGMFTGAIGANLSGWIYPELSSGGDPYVFGVNGVSLRVARLEVPIMVSFMTYFGILGFANGWWKLTDRDRPGRFRLWPIVKSAILGFMLMPLWGYREPWGPGIAALTALVLQLVSPWSKPAAEYARYVEKQKAITTHAA